MRCCDRRRRIRSNDRSCTSVDKEFPQRRKDAKEQTQALKHLPTNYCLLLCVFAPLRETHSCARVLRGVTSKPLTIEWMPKLRMPKKGPATRGNHRFGANRLLHTLCADDEHFQFEPDS